jgi:hypothetical protein
MTRALLFDLDDTLVVEEPVIVSAMPEEGLEPPTRGL